MIKIIMSTVPQSEASIICDKLLNKKLAACINILPLLESRYLWKGEIQVDKEALLIIKTLDSVLDELIREISNVHPYEIPEIVVLDVEQVNGPYFAWITETIA